MIAFLAATAVLFLVLDKEAALVGPAFLLAAWLARNAIDHALLRRPRQPRRLVGHADGRWTLLLNDGSRIDVRWRSGFIANAFMVAGGLEGEGQRHWFLATPVNSPDESRRRLAVRLRWMAAQDLWRE